MIEISHQYACSIMTHIPIFNGSKKKALVNNSNAKLYFYENLHKTVQNISKYSHTVAAGGYQIPRKVIRPLFRYQNNCK